MIATLKKPKNLAVNTVQLTIEKLQVDTESWRILPLSMTGRVNAITMVALPRFLYLNQSLAIYLNASFFKKLDSTVLLFIWGYKSQRLSKAHLHETLKKGGLGLPVFKHYYWAANSRALTGNVKVHRQKGTFHGYS